MFENPMYSSPLAADYDRFDDDFDDEHDDDRCEACGSADATIYGFCECSLCHCSGCPGCLESWDDVYPYLCEDCRESISPRAGSTPDSGA